MAYDTQGPFSYSNTFATTFSDTDIVVEFAQLIPISNEGEETSVERRLLERIVMSPVQAVALIEHLQDVVDAYEQEYGDIPRDTRAARSAEEADEVHED